jgi:hypothetical protein
MNKSILIFLFAMCTMGLGCSSLKLPVIQEGAVNPKTTEILPNYSLIITSNDLQADRSALMDLLMKGSLLIVEIKEWPLDGMRGELNVICKGDTKRINEIRDELLLTGQVVKVNISKQY